MNCSGILQRSTYVAGIILGSISIAQGQSITPVFEGTTTSGSNVLFNYQLNLGPDSTINSHSFVTFYDFKGLTGTPTFTAASSGLGSVATFGVSEQLLGKTPAFILPIGGDNPTLENVSFSYTGPSIANGVFGASSIDLGTVSIASTNGLSPGFFTPYSTQETSTQLGTTGATTNLIQGPNNSLFIIQSTPTPEPGAMALFVAAGITGTVPLLRRRRRSA